MAKVNNVVRLYDFKTEYDLHEAIDKDLEVSVGEEYGYIYKIQTVQIISSNKALVVFEENTDFLPVSFLYKYIKDEEWELPEKIEKKLCESVEESKREKYNMLVSEYPSRALQYEKLGYKRVEDIPEHIVFTCLDLTFSDEGKGLIKSQIRRMISDDLEDETGDVHFECDANLDIDVSDQIEDLKWLAHHYLDKIIFKERVLENYII